MQASASWAGRENLGNCFRFHMKYSTGGIENWAAAMPNWVKARAHFIDYDKGHKNWGNLHRWFDIMK